MTGDDVTEKESVDEIEELDGTSGEGEGDQIAALEAERDEYLTDLKRVAAEFDNFRKRAARERDAIVQRANERLIGECLVILDDLERALDADADDATLLEGVALVEQRLRGLIEKEGVAEIETDGVFDPHVHEALLTQPSEEAEGTILGVMQKGYAIGEVVLRPARVAVAGPLAPGDATSAAEKGGDGDTVA